MSAQVNQLSETPSDAFLVPKRAAAAFYVCLLVGDSAETCGHAAANAEPRAGDQYCQTSSSRRAGTGEEVCRPPAVRNSPRRDRERRRIWFQKLRMQWEGDVAVETARRQKQTGGKTV